MQLAYHLHLEQGKADQYVSQVVPIDIVRLDALEAATDLKILLEQKNDPVHKNVLRFQLRNIHNLAKFYDAISI